jgi:hypothetical protein
VPGLPDDAVKAIIERADGIPLYAVETVRSLVSDGRLHEEDGRYAPTDNLGELAVPPTLTALIASRLDALEAGDRALVQDAAVLGQSFGLDALAVVTGEDPAAIQPRVERLVRRELLMRDVDERSAERGQYAFVQSLIREVAYNTLARKDRKTRHLAAARYFEQLDSEELASAKAGHYLAARENAADGAEADALAAQARVALRSAADRAATLGAQDQAVAFLQQALTVTTEPADRADLLERAADSAAKASHYDLGADLARQAIEIRVSAGDRLAAARATAGLGYVYLTARRDAEGREVLEQALAEYGDLWPDPALAELKTLMARAHEQFNESQASVKLADEALEVAEHGNHPELLSRALITKGASLGSLGRLRESIALIRAGEEVAREHDLTELVITGLVVRGYHLGEIDNYAAAQCIRDGLALARRAGQRGMVHMFVNNLGYTGFLTGDWDEALDELDAVLAEDLDENTRVWLLSNELIIRASRGESISDGIAELDRLVADHDDLHVRTAPMDTKANEAQAQGRLEEAQRQWLALADNFISQGPASYYQAARPALWDGDLEAVRRYLELLDSTGFHGPVVEARRATIRAGIMALEGRAGESLAAYKEAITGWRELGIAWEEALTGIDVATVLDAALPEVQAIGTATRETLERLGARPYIERLDAALARQSAGQPAPAEAPTRPLAADAV